jgi:glycosyltransferase involved in cell wall biosynthesis
MKPASLPAILCLSTAGPTSMDGRRMHRLCAGLEAELVFHSVDRTAGRRASLRAVNKLLVSRRWDLVYLEGTGVVGGLPLLRAARARGLRFIVSSGDPIGGFFHVTRGPLVGRVFDFYERRLYRACTAFVGWTPYLTGAALRLGARRAITIEGGVDLARFRALSPGEKAAARGRFGLAADHLVCGVVGSLAWTPRQAYCYGLELIESLKRVTRRDISVLIVGDGDGLERLKAAVPLELKSRVVFTGRLPESEVVAAMNAMDIGFVTQSLDALGSFRLTTKLPEYLACGVPVAMSPIPGFYDYAQDAGWPLPPFHPASPEFHARCAAWLDALSAAEIAARAEHARGVAEERFDDERLGRKFRSFVEALLREDETF